MGNFFLLREEVSDLGRPRRWRLCDLRDPFFSERDFFHRRHSVAGGGLSGVSVLLLGGYVVCCRRVCLLIEVGSGI